MLARLESADQPAPRPWRSGRQLLLQSVAHYLRDRHAALVRDLARALEKGIICLEDEALHRDIMISMVVGQTRVDVQRRARSSTPDPASVRCNSTSGKQRS
jgi:hypothetical protein